VDMTLTVAMITLNEEKNLERTLKSVQDFADEIVIVDSGSTDRTEEIAKKQGIKVQKGVYVGLQGPTFETPAEYGMVRILGGDAVGMSTVPEVIVARHQGMEVCALSVITDLGGPDISPDVSHEEVLNAANIAMPNVVKLVKGLIEIYR